MIHEMQQRRKRCSKCSKLKIMTDYGTKKNGGEFLTCITCRRRSTTWRTRPWELKIPSRKKIPRRDLTMHKALKSLNRSMRAFTLNWLRNDWTLKEVINMLNQNWFKVKLHIVYIEMDTVNLMYEKFNDTTASRIIRFLEHPTTKMMNTV